MIGFLRVVILVALIVLHAPAYKGFAAHYGKTVMNKVAHNRGMAIEACMIATPYYPIGTWLHIHSLKNDLWKDCIVMDIPQPRDRAGIIARGIIVEFNWNAAKEMCDLTYVGQEPPSACPVEIWEYTRRALQYDEKEKSKL